MSVARWWAVTARARRLLAAVAAVLILWQAAVDLLNVPQVLVPAPTRVFNELIDDPVWLLTQSYYTLLATLLGFALALIIGVALAIAIVYSRFLEDTVYGALVSMNSIPKVAIAPLFIIWVGTGIGSKITMAAIIAVFAIVIDTVLGLRSIDPDMIDLARSLGGRQFSILVKIRFPNALPSLFAGMKVAISLALVGTIVGEFVAASSGLGYVIMVAESTFDTARVFAALVVLAVMGMALFFAIDLLERILLPWHVSQRRDELV
jgi:NitT/TauT family transport system permease protein